MFSYSSKCFFQFAFTLVIAVNITEIIAQSEVTILSKKKEENNQLNKLGFVNNPLTKDNSYFDSLTVEEYTQTSPRLDLRYMRNSGVVYVNIKHSVYGFLERLSLKEVILFNDEVKPKTRRYIAEYLLKIEDKTELLNYLEKEEFIWYKAEFANEFTAPYLKERWHLYSYTDSVFSLRMNPIVGYGISESAGNSGYEKWWGIDIYAGYSDWFGLTINMRDKGEFGSNVDKNKKFTPKTGHTISGAPNGVEYSDVKGSLNFGWGWGAISLQKDYFTWGHGKFGQLIHSTKAPSYPFVRLDFQPVEWLRFYYIHGWLNSNFVDSIGIYYRADPFQRSNGLQFVKKNIVMNFFSITPYDWVDISFGNSSVYKGDIRTEFLIPFLFFKYLDRDVGKGSIEDGNGQLHLDVSLRFPKTYKFYGTFFLDVTEIRNVLKNQWYNTWFGITLGGTKIDLFVPNLDLTLEYTRVSPWVYEHRDSATSYKHIDYVLGHWIGQNADLLRMQLDYSFINRLKFSLYGEMIRKGGLKNIQIAYETKDYLPFLYGDVRKEMRVGLDVSYEYSHDLFLNSYINYVDISDQDPVRTPSWQLGKYFSFGMIVSYGL